ncbi:hypothetical protein BJX63DRAFT_354350 [Aspergillus granulosus]|uniref:Uncharacterized protein n=1 Tax=Aspergillus granulosus TaxID=176169 RepID=A0ABR4H411_9EURO
MTGRKCQCCPPSGLTRYPLLSLVRFRFTDCVRAGGVGGCNMSGEIGTQLERPSTGHYSPCFVYARHVRHPPAPCPTCQIARLPIKRGPLFKRLLQVRKKMGSHAAPVPELELESPQPATEGTMSRRLAFRTAAVSIQFGCPILRLV